MKATVPHFTPPARVITLDRNYRSTEPILATANAVIDLAVKRHRKNLRSERPSAEQPQLVSVRDETDQPRYVVDRVLEYREAGVLLKQQAVRSALPITVARSSELARRNIPFVKYGGLKFLEAALRRAICQGHSVVGRRGKQPGDGGAYFAGADNGDIFHIPSGGANEPPRALGLTRPRQRKGG